MTKNDYKIYFLYKKFDEKIAHDFLVKCRKRDRAGFSIEQNVKIICIEDCYWIEKTIFQHEFTTEEIEEYIEENWIYIHSMYDCTGRTFTRDIRCFPLNGKTIVYHFKAIDCQLLKHNADGKGKIPLVKLLPKYPKYWDAQ